MRPLFGDSLYEISGSLDGKLRQSELQAFLFQPHSDSSQALDALRGMLSLPTIKAQVNYRDRHGWTALAYATRAFQEAVELLLQAGASLEAGAYLLHQFGRDKWSTVSALIRAGYPTDRRSSHRFGRSPLHSVPTHPRPGARHALELVRHGGHLLNWEARDDYGNTPLDLAERIANAKPDDEQLQLIHEIYRTRRVPSHAQYISSFDGERLMGAEEVAARPCVSLIDTALAGDIKLIGRLISAGAMVNERDEHGRTLLHLVAMGGRVPNGYCVALELVRHGGRRGVDWDAVADDGRTAAQLTDTALKREDLDDSARIELGKLRELLRQRRLPPGESYVFPCMDPDFCEECKLLPCVCPENDVRGMPGSLY